MAYLAKISVDSVDFVSVAGLDGSVDGETDYRISKGHRLSPPELATLPSRARVEDDVREIVRDFHMLKSCWAVSDRFRQIVETLEPNVHQFAPVVFVNKNNEPFDKRFFHFHVLNRVDAIDVEHSDARWHYMRDGNGNIYGESLNIGSSKPKLTLQNSIIDGLHVWKGKEQLTVHTFFSNCLMKEVNLASLKGLTAFRTEEA